jgi:hypothetical protein
MSRLDRTSHVIERDASTHLVRIRSTQLRNDDGEHRTASRARRTIVRVVSELEQVRRRKSTLQHTFNFVFIQTGVVDTLNEHVRQSTQSDDRIVEHGLSVSLVGTSRALLSLV